MKIKGGSEHSPSHAQPEQRQLLLEQLGPSPGHRGAAPAIPQGCAPRAWAATHLNLPQDIQAFRDLPEYHVLAVQPIRLVTR